MIITVFTISLGIVGGSKAYLLRSLERAEYVYTALRSYRVSATDFILSRSSPLETCRVALRREETEVKNQDRLERKESWPDEVT